jgi:hypothetical protein
MIAQKPIERCAADAEKFGGFGFVAAGFYQR